MKVILTIAAIILASITISAQVNFTVQTEPICDGTTQTGSAYINVTNGTPPFSYEWSGPVSGNGTSDTITGLVYGAYYVTVTDASAGSFSQFFTIDSIYIGLQVDTSTTCDGRLFLYPEGDYSSSATIGGGPFEFNGFAYIVTDNNTDYYAIYTSPDGCTVTDTFNSGIIPKLETNVTVSQYSCTNGSEVTVELIGSDQNKVDHDITVDWSRVQWGYNQTYPHTWEITHGVYIITTRDTSAAMLAQCPYNYVDDTLFINADTSWAANDFVQASVSISIADTCTDQVTLTGVPAYQIWGWSEYTWYGPNGFRDTGEVITVTDPGNGSPYYDLQIETWGCLAYGSTNGMVFPPFPDGFTLDISSTTATCSGNGTATATPSNSNATYNFSWDNGDTSSTITNLSAGTYHVTVTSSNHCVKIDSITVQSTGGTNIQIDSVTTVKPTCGISANGSIEVFASSIDPIDSYLWSNGDTTALITDLLPGTYAVTVGNASGCTYRHVVVLDDTGLELQINKTQNLDCVTGTGGKLKVVANAGTAPYTYLWNIGSSTTDTINNLVVGGYTVTVTDDNGCSESVHYSLDPEPSCFSELSGRVYADMDTSCSVTAGDIGLAGRMVKIEPGYYAYTNSTGNWQVQVAPGQQYKTYLVNDGPNLLNDGCGIDTLNVSVPDTNNITNLFLPKHTSINTDVSISMSSGINRPGFTTIIYVTIQNNDFNTVSGSGSILLDDKYQNVSVSSISANITIDSVSSSAPFIVYYSYNNLSPFSIRNLSISVTVPPIPTVALGEVLTSSAQITTHNGNDIDLSNNIDTIRITVTGAYDPNDKQVFSNEESIDGLALPTDTLLEYLVRFQNTGTDTAFNVVIRDTLDDALDPGTFKVLSSSHPVDVQFYQDNIVHFNFYNILLPDSNVNEPESHGFVAFEIEIAEPGLLQPISNQAAIYFDYNPPIYTNTVESTPAERPIISGPSELCLGETITLSADTLSKFSYIWTNNSVPVSGFTGDEIIVTSAGDYQLALIQGDDTIWSAAKQVTVNPLPSVSVTPPLTSLCADASAVSITVSPTGGVLTGDGVSGTSFDPATAGVGAHQLTYEYTDGNNCLATAYETVTVNPTPNVTLATATSSLCEDASAVSINVSPAGGVLTGDGVSGTSFDPATAGVGAHQLTYEYTDGNNCSATAFETVTVNATPNVTLTAASSSLCEDASAVSLNVSPTGGVLSGDGVSGTSFDPATAGVGAHQLTYEYTDGNNCSATAYETVTVNTSPIVTFAAATSSLCEDAAAVSINVSPAGGVLTGDGVSGTSFDPATAGVGAHQLTYEYTDGNNCSATAYETVTVNANPTATLSAASNSLCEDASAVSINVSPAGGVLTGDGVSGTSFDPATAGVGSHQLTYEYTDGNNCSATAYETVTVNAKPTATLSAPSNSLCEDASAVSINVSPAGGTLTGDGVSGTSFDPATAGVGAHQLTYEFTDGNNCSATAYETVTVNASPIVTFAAATSSLCEDAAAVSINVSPAGGVLTGDGVSGTSFDPATAGVGAHQLTYEYTDGNNCSATAYETVTVNENPTASFSLPSDPLCENDQALDISGYVSPAGGVIAGTGVTGTTLDISSAGTYSLTYTYTDNNGCAATAQASAVVEVCIGIEDAELPVASIHPNPTNGLVTISVEGRTIDQVILMDVTGKQVQVQPILTVGQAIIDLSDLASGMYMLHILSEGNWYSERVVLQR